MSRRLVFGVALLTLALLSAAIVAVLAQDQPKAPTLPDEKKAKVAVPDEVKAARKEAAVERGKGDPQLQWAGLMARSLASQPAIAVAGDHVYVVKGNTLYQFSVDGLRLLAKAELEQPPAEGNARAEAAKRWKLERTRVPVQE